MIKIGYLGFYLLIYLLSTCVMTKEERLLRATKLTAGDRVAIIAPGFQPRPEQIRLASQRVQALGLQPQVNPVINQQWGYFAGSIQARAEAINQAFADPEIKALFVIRGGYGSALLLDHLDYQLIKQNPKILLGYSDITALLVGLYQRLGLVTFHGPVAGQQWPEFSVNYLREVLFAGDKARFINPQPLDLKKDIIASQNPVRTINSGTVEGRLLGGNLSVLVSLVGTPYWPEDWRNSILFIEEVGEAVYRIDRMLAQLKMVGVLDQLAGFVLGTCRDCRPQAFGGFRLEQVIDRYIKPLGIPAYSGALIGHQDKNFTLPVGGLVRLDADKGSITMLEPGVT
jgi:muramoyltetrapeptide carboxypeptidase